MHQLFRPHWLIGLLLFGLTRAITWFVLYFFPDLIVKNPGAIFGRLTDAYLVGLVLVIGFLLLAKLFWTPVGWLGKWGMTLLVVGGLANLCDRVLLGSVIDYIPLGSWSTFNLADLQIILGAGFLILDRPTLP